MFRSGIIAHERSTWNCTKCEPHNALSMVPASVIDQTAVETCADMTIQQVASNPSQ